MATIIVNTTLDENDGSITDGDVSLRDAIAFADSQAGADTINFASGAGEALGGGGTIRLDAALGELVLSTDVTIDGDIDDDGAPDVTITGDTLGDDALTSDPLGNAITDVFKNDNKTDNLRVMSITGGSSTLDGLVITGGSLSGSGNNGAAVLISEGATVTMTHSSVTGNQSGWVGGGIWNAGTLTVFSTTISGNSSDNNAGGFWNSGTATLTSSTVSGNSSDNNAGGFGNDGTVTATNTTVSGNSARDLGGGIYNRGTATLTNTTVSGNSAERDGGGIWSYGRSGTTTLTNTIVLGNSAPVGPEIEGTITENGSNIVGVLPLSYVFASVGPNTYTGVESGLLADNSGAVQTIALNPHPGNPALDAGSDDRLDESITGIDLSGDGNTDDVIDTDARGARFARLVDLPDIANNEANSVDLGAFELDSVIANTAPTIVSAAKASVPEAQKAAIDVEATDNFNSEGWGLTYALMGGADAAFFDLDTVTGILTFINAPDFEIPGDADGDNDYEVQVTVTDVDGLTDVQDITIGVTDVIMDQSQTFVVTIADDERDDLDGLGTVSFANFGGADDLSLREAIALADEFPFIADTITFASGPNEAFEGGGTIRLDQALGALVLSSDVTIDGDIDDDPASRDITIDAQGTVDAQGNSRVLNITAGTSTIDSLWITGAKSKWLGDPEEGFSPAPGNGIEVADGATLSVTNSTVSGNETGIHNAGILILTDTTVSTSRNADYDGDGGTGLVNTGTATLTNTTVSDNSSRYGAGGIHNSGTATLTDSIV